MTCLAVCQNKQTKIFLDKAMYAHWNGFSEAVFAFIRDLNRQFNLIN